MHNFKRNLFLSLLLVFSIILTACGGNGSSAASKSGKPKKGGTLVVALNTDISTLDPQRESGWETYRVNRQIYESLVTEDLTKSSQKSPVPKLIPGLAKSWNISKDGLTYTFNLRKNVKFQDGTDFNAKAVEFNIRRAWDPKFKYYDKISAVRMENTFRYLKNIKIVNNYKIVLSFKQPFSSFLRMLAQGSGGSGLIFSPASLKKWGNDAYAEHPAGTGPFKFVERVPGEKIVLERNDNYWGKKAYLKKVIFRPIVDDNARVTALETGGADIISWPPPDSVSSLKNKGFRIGRDDNFPSVFYYAFNTNNKFFKDKRVRQAVVYAIDRKGLAKDLLKDTVAPAYSLQVPGNEGYDPNFKDYDYNVKKAKALLKEAGYPDGFKTKLITYSGKEAIAEWVQRNLSKIGIKLQIITTDFNSFATKGLRVGLTSDKELGLTSMEYGFVTPYWLYIAANYKSPSDYGSYNNKEFNLATEQAIAQTNKKKTSEYWTKANHILAEDAAFAPLYYERVPYILGKNVHGFVIPAQVSYDLK